MAEDEGRRGGRGGRRGRGRPRKEEMVDGNLEPKPVPDGANVPKNIKGMLRQLLQQQEGGTLLQAKVGPTWKRTFPDTPLDYKEWGFERLRDFLGIYPDVITVNRPEGARDFSVSLAGQALPAAPAAKGADPAAVESFLAQPKLRFTIDCLAEEFAKFQAAGGGAKKTKKRPPRGRGRGRGAGAVAAEDA